MSVPTQLSTQSNTSQIWAGRILSWLVILFLVVDGAMKVINAPQVKEAMIPLGYPEGVAPPLGIVLLISTALYAFTPTAILGAILLTGYLGGATATHVRVGHPFIFPVVFGIVMWAGLYLRDPRLQSLIPVRRKVGADQAM